MQFWLRQSYSPVSWFVAFVSREPKSTSLIIAKVPLNGFQDEEKSDQINTNCPVFALGLCRYAPCCDDGVDTGRKIIFAVGIIHIAGLPSTATASNAFS